MSDLRFQSYNFLNSFLIITKITEFRQVDEDQHHVSSSLIESEKLQRVNDEFPKQLKAAAEAWGRHDKKLTSH